MEAVRILTENDSKHFLSVVLVMSLLVGCHSAAGHESKLLSGNPAFAAPVLKPARSEQFASKVDGQIAVKQEIHAPRPTIAYVKYLAGESGSPTCILEISENGTIVAKNSEMVECGLMSSPKMVAVEISGTPSDLIVFQQKTKGTNFYSLKRSSAGDWVVTKAEFVHPQDNLETGDVDVIKETADLDDAPVPLNIYTPDSIKERLAQSIVK